MIVKHRKKRNRYGEKLILQTGHNDNNNNQLKLQIPCCNHIDKDTQSSSNHSQSSYGAASSSEPSTFIGTPKMLARNKCLTANTFHHPQCVKLLTSNGNDSDTNFYASTDIIVGSNAAQEHATGLRAVCGNSLIVRATTNTPQMIVPPRKVELIASDFVPPGELHGDGRFGQVRDRIKDSNGSVYCFVLDFDRFCTFTPSCRDSTFDQSLTDVAIPVRSGDATALLHRSSQSGQHPLQNLGWLSSSLRIHRTG